VKRSVRVLRRAQIDLLEIQAYVVRDNPAAAASLIGRLLGLLMSLETLSERGSVPRDAHLRRAGYRYVRAGEYLVFHKVRRSQVRVYRVLHGRRLYKHLL
jgi:plasmid stabilization system protein ParE